MSKRISRTVIMKDGKKQPLCSAKIKTYGNIWTRELKYEKAGEIKKGHKHIFDHLHFLAIGSVLISVYDKKDRDVLIFQKEYKAPSWIKVPKDHFHDIVALADNTLGYCIQALVTEDGNVADTDYANDKDRIEEVNNFDKENNCIDETKK